MKHLTTCLFVFLFATSALAQNRAIIVTTDYVTGSLSSLDLSTNTATKNILTIHSDAAVRTYQNKVYIINRLGQDNIIALDSNNLKTPLKQYSVGNGSNPHDIVFVSEKKAYVSRNNLNRLLIVNPITGDSLGTVDLFTFADADGLPEASQMAIYNNRLFVVCQRLDQKGSFGPTDFSVIAVVDVATNQLVDVNTTTAGIQGIVMAGKNPTGAALQGNKWILSTVNTFGSLTDGGIEVINLDSLKTEGIVINETTIGGNLNALAMKSSSEGYIVLSDANFANVVKPFNLTTKTIASALSNISGGYIPALSVFGNRLYILDQGSFTDPASGGVKAFDITTNQLVAGPINVGLPPSGIAFLGSAVSLSSDFDNSGRVDFPDFLVFAAAFGKSTGQSGFDVKFDLDNSGSVDFPDFLKFVTEFGKTNNG